MNDAKCYFYDRFASYNVIWQDEIGEEKLEKFDHQVAGHGHGSGEKIKGMLKLDGTIILKPVQPFPRGIREIGFYEHVFMEENVEEEVVVLRNLIPAYHGTIKIKSEQDLESKDKLFFKLEDLTRRFRCPCIMDVKIGKICWDPLAGEDKIKRAMSASVLLPKVGFRILGFKVFNDMTHDYQYFDNAFGKSLKTEEELKNAFTTFFSAAHGKRKQAILTAILLELERIKDWFEKQRTYMVRSSSIVIIYEGGRSANCELACKADIDVTVKMIDFAHVFETNGHDNNFLEGINGLISTLLPLM